MPDTQKNTLFYGNNLLILRDYVATESVDLIYLDPPFNSDREYSVLFKEATGQESEAQITAFLDTWHWGPTSERAYHALVNAGDPHVAIMIGALRQSLGVCDILAYLVMMTERLVELHRVLKPTGSLYLHCDPTASHYLKMVLDAIFGPDNFLSEIIWKRTSAHSSARRPGPVHDVLLLYVKSSDYLWNPIHRPYTQDYVESAYKNTDPDGRQWKSSDLTGAGVRHGETGRPWHDIDITAKGRHWAYVPSELDELERQGKIYWPTKKGGMPRLKQYLDDMPGVPLQDVWTDIPPIGARAAERLGYPTQKPVALLERILSGSSNPGDLVLDPFCGCGTTIAAAQQLGRRWLGIDISHLAVALQKYRLKDAFDLVEKRDYQVVGEPQDLASARQLAQDDRYQFQWWALSLVKARPVGPQTGAERVGKKGADRGVDGLITFTDDTTSRPKLVIVQVKSGKVKSSDIRDLRGVVERQEAAIGVFITLEPPSQEMRVEATAAGSYHSPGWDKDYPRLQILTITDLLEGAAVQMPPSASTFKTAEKVKPDAPAQPNLLY